MTIETTSAASGTRNRRTVLIAARLRLDMREGELAFEAKQVADLPDDDKGRLRFERAKLGFRRRELNDAIRSYNETALPSRKVDICHGT